VDTFFGLPVTWSRFSKSTRLGELVCRFWAETMRPRRSELIAAALRWQRWLTRSRTDGRPLPVRAGDRTTRRWMRGFGRSSTRSGWAFCRSSSPELWRTASTSWFWRAGRCAPSARPSTCLLLPSPTSESCTSNSFVSGSSGPRSVTAVFPPKLYARFWGPIFEKS